MTMSIAAVIILIAVTGFAIMKKKSKNKKRSQDNSTPDTSASKSEGYSEQGNSMVFKQLMLWEIKLG